MYALIALALLLGASLAAPAYAGVDNRPVWTMTCFPSVGKPYEVTVNVHTNLLTVVGAGSHFARSYQVVGNREVGNGFIVTAEGRGRHLEAGFSAQEGILSTGDKYDHCGSDL